MQFILEFIGAPNVDFSPIITSVKYRLTLENRFPPVKLITLWDILIKHKHIFFNDPSSTSLVVMDIALMRSQWDLNRIACCQDKERYGDLNILDYWIWE